MAGSKGFGRDPKDVSLTVPTVVQKTMQKVNTALEAGRLHEARALCEQVLQVHPQHVEALRCSSLASHRLGAHEDAVALGRKLVEIRPNSVEALSNLGSLLIAAGHSEEAISVLQQAIMQRTDAAALYVNLGHALSLGSRFLEAIDAYRKVLILQPRNLDVLERLLQVLARLQRWSEALEICNQFVHQYPTVHAYLCLGNLHEQMGNLAAAETVFQEALRLSPHLPIAHFRYASVLRSLERHDETEAAFRRLVAVSPADPWADYNLGLVLREQACRFSDVIRLQEAQTFLRRAIALKPDLIQAHNNLGNIWQDLGKLQEAESSFRQAIALKADYADACTNLGALRLLLGDFKTGWQLIEWRLLTSALKVIPIAKPLWDGSELSGRTILLWAEQGYGDAIMFVRYVSLVKAKGARVILACRAPETRLFASCTGVDQLVIQGETLPDFDVHAPLLSLPHRLGTELTSIPVDVPYLSAPEVTHLPEEVQERLRTAPGLKIGFVWVSKLGTAKDFKRRVSLDLWQPLFALPSLSWFSLYKGDLRHELTPFADRVSDVGTYCEDFADLAWAMDRLDLIITMDTASAHLAGALGRPVWVLLPFANDWRWLLDRADSPWYPTARLFRQPSFGDWQSVIAQLATALTERSTQAFTAS
jgi:tetratricopeptide (TPR) repeat protein